MFSECLEHLCDSKIWRAFAVYQTQSELIKFECVHVFCIDEFLLALYIYDLFFTQVLSNDFFLVACLDDFIENARLFIFETFCRIHQCISIK